MLSKNPAQYLRDILDNISAIGRFSTGPDPTAVRSDQKTVYAMVRALEIISEASRRLPNAILDRYPDIKWVAIAAAGNVYRHEYGSVNEAIIWVTVDKHLEPLRAMADGDGIGAPVRLPSLKT